MRGPSRKVRDSNWRAMHGEAAASSEVSTATKTATTTKAATMASAATAKSTSTATSTSTAAVPSRPRGVTEDGKQTEANNAKYSFCFHILSSRQPRVPAIAHPVDFRILPKTY